MDLASLKEESPGPGIDHPALCSCKCNATRQAWRTSLKNDCELCLTTTYNLVLTFQYNAKNCHTSQEYVTADTEQTSLIPGRLQPMRLVYGRNDNDQPNRDVHQKNGTITDHVLFFCITIHMCLIRGTITSLFIRMDDYVKLNPITDSGLVELEASLNLRFLSQKLDIPCRRVSTKFLRRRSKM